MEWPYPIISFPTDSKENLQSWLHILAPTLEGYRSHQHLLLGEGMIIEESQQTIGHHQRQHRR